MSKTNKSKFENYPNQNYFKNNDQAVFNFPSLIKFPMALGYDKKSMGFIVLHKKHQASGIEQEIPACIILKKASFCVELVSEEGDLKNADANINEQLVEIKRVSKATNISNAVMSQFKRCEKKSYSMLLHIDQRCEPSNLKRMIRKASERYDKIKKLILVFRSSIIELERNEMLSGNYRI
jgi:hypothetical protein